MKQYLVIIVLIIMGLGCRTAPKRNLSTVAGTMAAFFNIDESEVTTLKEKGMTDEDAIKTLLISSASYLTVADIMIMKEEGKILEEIGKEVEIAPNLLHQKTENILTQLTEIRLKHQ